ncbi:hypothetical protein RCL1_002097 [Eukaryota sp. TZLM3-RCL]
MSDPDEFHVPPAIKLAADKTAKFFVRNGPSFEDMVRRQKGNLPEFVFLKEDHPYHKYYQSCIKKYLEHPELLDSKPVAVVEQTPAPPEIKVTEAPAKLERFRERLPVPSSKPHPLDFAITYPQDLDALTLERMKITAQYVAKNGRSFLALLAKNEASNQNLSFLNPSSSLFSFFTVLVHNYQKILKHGTLSDMKTRFKHLSLFSNDKFSYLQFIKERAGWERKQRNSGDNEEVMEEEAIDWSNFVVVQTINFD